MARLIDVDSTVKAISKLAEDMSINDRAVALLLALELNNEDRFPTVDVAPVKHGHWIREENNAHVEPSGICSVCGSGWLMSDTEYFLWCPNCGALMDEVSE